ncbi:MAG: hypothetical protein ACP5NN_10640 [Methanolinea sp.]
MVGGVGVSANAIVVRQIEHKNKRITILNDFFENAHMREWWMGVSKKVLRRGRTNQEFLVVLRYTPPTHAISLGIIQFL